tara:strand:+ start:42 stop:521 length:480 start_codon:yes stop_codon:yes gene_type:complete
MPLPTPRDGEKRAKFMDRCMSDLISKDEFKDGKQRAAVCYSQFKKAESKASLIVGNPLNEDDLCYYFSKSSDGPMDHYRETKEEAIADAVKFGLKGYHSFKNDKGKTLYMAGPDYKTFSSLWENIRKKRERIKRGSGEKMRKKGDKGAPTPEQIKKAKN